MIIGNWKMYKTVGEALRFVQTLAPLVEKSQAQVGLAVPFTVLYPLSHLLREMEVSIKVGAQNMSDNAEGAFTGEISGRMLVDSGAQFVLIGHSERRHIFHESNPFINRKVRLALQEELPVILCIGETLAEREKGAVESVLTKQILESLEGVDNLALITLAYEPVWAIGTGKVAHPDDAQKVHHFCRKTIANKWGDKAANGMVIQYGGSVKPENASKILAEEDVDGLLVGGASLSPDSFSQIINSYKD
ncbi:MAG: triose-phosphate isomerase [Chlamydiales bacterium]